MFRTNFNFFKTLFFIGILFISCSQDDNQKSSGYSESSVTLPTHKLRVYNVKKDSKYLVVCESGLGDGHESWAPQKSDLIDLSSEINSDILVYDLSLIHI